MRYFDKIIDSDQDGQMVKTIISALHPGRKLRRALIEQGSIQVNGVAVYLSSRVHQGDRVTVDAPHDDRLIVSPEALPLQVWYEDEHLLVVDKPAGMVVHPTPGVRTSTLIAAVAYHLRTSGENQRFFLMHRLDRDTSGLVLLAKHKLAQERLARHMRRHEIQREYVAYVRGIVSEEERAIDAPIGRCPNAGTRRAVMPYGQAAVTALRVLARYRPANVSKVSLKLGSGRTHQIRVHLSFIGHAVIGDRVYGDDFWSQGIPRQALHAANLTFVHPISRAVIAVHSPLPQDMVDLQGHLSM